MRLVKTRPRYRCDYCRRVSTEEAMKRHERICWLNPNRTCDICGGKGRYTEVYGDLVYEGDCGLSQEVDCYFCSQFQTREQWEQSLGNEETAPC